MGLHTLLFLGVHGIAVQLRSTEIDQVDIMRKLYSNVDATEWVSAAGFRRPLRYSLVTGRANALRTIIK